LRKFLLILAASAVLVLAVCSSASPGGGGQVGPPVLAVGATEGQPLGYDDGGSALFFDMGRYGLGMVRMSVAYEPAEPTTIQQQAQLERAVRAATARGLRVLLGISPAHNTDVTGDPQGVRKFAAYTGLVAQAFPEVNDFIVGNEPNLGRFWFPTFKRNGTIAAAATYEKALAASYDALKAVDANIDVIGLAVSSRGDDRPGSRRNTISPVRFIKAVGDAYRASPRTKPIMDNVALHPYPFANLDPPEKGAAWPNVSVPNLDRAQQAFWDGFHGTAQPTFAESGVHNGHSAAPPVRWILDEAGWQTGTRGLPGYFGHENTPTITEATQARYYRSVVQRYVCDPRVAALLFFHWIDEGDRDRFQTGLVRADTTIKPAAKAVKDAIGAGCLGARSRWRHSTGVNGATVTWKPKSGFLFHTKAFEDATFTATATPTGKTLKQAKKLGKKLKPATVKGKVKAYIAHGVKFKGINAATAPKYTYSVRIAAALNADRRSTLKRNRLLNL
jgi:hypothetical protein